MKANRNKSILALLFFVILLAYACGDLDWRRDERRNNAIQPPEKIIRLLEIREGMVIGEFGAGYGRLTIPLARSVGKRGTIYASDIDKRSLKYLEKRCRKAGLSNVITILGNYENPLFMNTSLDMAFSSLVYHEIENPVVFLKNLIPSLKPDAPIVIVDYNPRVNTEESNVGRDWEREFDDAGLKIVRFETLSERDVMYILKPTH